MNQPADYPLRAHNRGRSAQVIQVESAKFIPQVLILAAIGAVSGIVALAVVLLKLNDYTDQIALEKRLNTQAIDEMRLEANVSRKLSGLPVVDSHEHGDDK